MECHQCRYSGTLPCTSARPPRRCHTYAEAHRRASVTHHQTLSPPLHSRFAFSSVLIMYSRNSITLSLVNYPTLVLFPPSRTYMDSILPTYILVYASFSIHCCSFLFVLFSSPPVLPASVYHCIRISIFDCLLFFVVDGMKLLIGSDFLRGALCRSTLRCGIRR